MAGYTAGKSSPKRNSPRLDGGPLGSPVRETSKAAIGVADDGTIESINDYRVVGLAGEGSYARVYEVTRDMGPERGEVTFAAKVMNKSLLRRKRNFEQRGRRTVVSTALDNVEREVALMKKLEHPNIVQLYEVIDDMESDLLVMIIEFMAQGPIMDYDEGSQHFVVRGTHTELTEAQAAWTMKSVLLGVAYLHSNHIAHRDLKPDNILRAEDGRVKLADFGVSHFFEKEEEMEPKDLRVLVRQSSRGATTKTEGTYAFWAPEMCLPLHPDKPHWSAYGADLWAAGVCLWVFIFGTLPFDVTGGMGVLFDEIEAYEDANLQMPHAVDPALEDFIRKLLTKDPAQRMSVPEALRHPWLLRHCGEAAVADEAAMTRASLEPTPEEVREAFSPMLSIVIITKVERRMKKRLSEARERLSSRSSRSPPDPAAKKLDGGSDEAAEQEDAKGATLGRENNDMIKAVAAATSRAAEMNAGKPREAKDLDVRHSSPNRGRPRFWPGRGLRATFSDPRGGAGEMRAPGRKPRTLSCVTM